MSSHPSEGFWGWLSTALHSQTHAVSLHLWVLRGCFGIIIIGAATFALTHALSEKIEPLYGILAFFCVLMLALLIVFTDMLVRNKQITSISAIYFGLLLGLFLGWLFSMALEPFVG